MDVLTPLQPAIASKAAQKLMNLSHRFMLDIGLNLISQLPYAAVKSTLITISVL
tara:strand:+ start:55 stop:216 length:162 start_codon:yes stop_codon:yes gene_type:complete